MEKRGSRGREASKGVARSSRPISHGAKSRFAAESAEKCGLGAVDLIGIVLVIAFLGLIFGALLANRNERFGLFAHEWAERLTATVISWVPRGEAEAAAPSSAPQAAR